MEQPHPSRYAPSPSPSIVHPRTTLAWRIRWGRDDARANSIISVVKGIEASGSMSMGEMRAPIRRNPYKLVMLNSERLRIAIALEESASC